MLDIHVIETAKLAAIISDAIHNDSENYSLLYDVRDLHQAIAVVSTVGHDKMRALWDTEEREQFEDCDLIAWLMKEDSDRRLAECAQIPVKSKRTPGVIGDIEREAIDLWDKVLQHRPS